MYNGKFKYIHHRYNTIKHQLLNKIIFIEYIMLMKNIVDPLTEGLTKKARIQFIEENRLKAFKNEIVL